MVNEEVDKKKQEESSLKEPKSSSAPEDSPDSSPPRKKDDSAAPVIQSEKSQNGDTIVSDAPDEAGAGAKKGFGIGKLQLSRIIFPVIIGILVVAVIAIFAKFRSQSSLLSEEVETRQTLEVQVNDLENQLTTQIRESNELTNGLKTLQTERDQLQAESSTLKSGNTQLQAQLENALAFSRTLEERLKAEKAALAELQTTTREDRQTQKRLYTKIEELLEEKKDLQDKLFQAKSGGASTAVEMPGLVVKNNQSAIPSLRGTILTVNQNYAFVIINRGDSDGVKKGDRFRVLDRNNEIGEVVATRILPDMTIADIDPRQTHRRLEKGFSVYLHE
ncbi:MAG: hypothetical protein U9N73_11655 [Candidatus Auribacterota bacterium]|nr:hypothetical protein [Candidatus Auribacterota bacterium]